VRTLPRRQADPYDDGSSDGSNRAKAVLGRIHADLASPMEVESIDDVKMSKGFWAEAGVTSAYIINRIPTSSLPGKTPYELVEGRKPNVSHMRVFGAKTFARVHPNVRQKLDSKTTIRPTSSRNLWARSNSPRCGANSALGRLCTSSRVRMLDGDARYAAPSRTLRQRPTRPTFSRNRSHVTHSSIIARHLVSQRHTTRTRPRRPSGSVGSRSPRPLGWCEH